MIKLLNCHRCGYVDEEKNFYHLDEEYAKTLLGWVITGDKLNSVSWLEDILNEDLLEIKKFWEDRDGILLVFDYSYPMADRGGFVVVDKNNQSKVMAYKTLVMG